jgi:CRP-like cAMP-binding protein
MSKQDLAGQKTVTFKRGDMIFRQGETTRDLYIIKSGQIRVFKTEGSVEIDLDVSGPGSVVGEIAAIDGGPRTASAVAEIDTEAFWIAPETFTSLLAKMPDWFRKIAIILTRRLREVDKKIDRNIAGDKSNQIAALIALMHASGRPAEGENPDEIAIKELENEAMDILNIPLNEITELLQSLTTRGIIKMEKSRLLVVNKEQLHSMEQALFTESEELPEAT